ncbi:protein PHYTOCHROME KINASE SUBSTRATE 3-like [Punica granatum]|uniref:Uncharacterized protein n=2 Tax=Punica granatum TaxID=22663 RepID=A0A218WBP5_PUNGR|nr:protein PHYTOCHROME KINASE SUBSTRATE 3-like [Punica granatum]OWM70066.1 hypothetical protein CDL15_Pgr025915 [Punica granatum]PKI72391.1 hypothetical protein CRG98_007261 [Punica granatum]
MESENTITDLRTASFSVYLNTAQDALVKKLTDQVQLPSSTIIPTEESPVVPVRPGKVVPKDAEIGVFGAEKYFNMKIDDDEPISTTPRLVVDDYARKLGHKKEKCVEPYYANSKRRLGTPSISSESSWGSQTAFLRNLQRNLSYSRHSNKASDQGGFFAGFRCNKSCADRKSIYVSKRVSRQEVATQINGTVPLGSSGRKLTSQSLPHSNPRTALQSRDEFSSPSFEKLRGESKRMEPFAFPLLINAPKAVEEPRISLEVFGSHAKKRADNVVAMNLERKLSMLTWDAIPKAKIHKSPTKMEEDMGSEASSELFEIENISGTTTIPPSTCYEPSEASIEWSVVTASAADFSVLSEYDEKEVLADIRGANKIPTLSSRPNFTRNSNEKEVPKSRPSGLLGCKSHKALQVAETVHKTSEKPRTPRPHLRLEAAIP